MKEYDIEEYKFKNKAIKPAERNPHKNNKEFIQRER